MYRRRWKNLKYTDVTRQFHCDNDDFIQVERANESGNGEVPCRAEAFVAFEKRFPWFEVQKERQKKKVTLCSYLR